jgi:hypothetical protein
VSLFFRATTEAADCQKNWKFFGPGRLSPWWKSQFLEEARLLQEGIARGVTGKKTG